MALITTVPLEDGDAATAVSLNSRFSALANAINDLEDSAVARGAFRHFHLPGFMMDVGFDPVVIGTNNTEHGPYIDGSWQAITDSTAAVLQTALVSPGVELGMSNANGIQGLFIFANVELWRMEDGTDPTGLVSPLNLACFKLEWYDGSSWSDVPASLTGWSQDLSGTTRPINAITAAISAVPRQQADIPLAGYLSESDVGGNAVERIRVVVRAYAATTTTSSTGTAVWTDPEVYLKRGSLYVLAPHAGG